MDNSLHILVVEDSLIALVVIKTQLTRLGCQVDTATDGESALKKVLLHSYDLILMDIGLGEGPDGFDVAASIKQKSLINKSTPIMAVTSHGEKEYIERAVEVGMVGFFHKPFTLEDAMKIIEHVEKPELRCMSHTPALDWFF